MSGYDCTLLLVLLHTRYLSVGASYLQAKSDWFPPMAVSNSANILRTWQKWCHNWRWQGKPNFWLDEAKWLRKNHFCVEYKRKAKSFSRCMLFSQLHVPSFGQWFPSCVSFNFHERELWSSIVFTYFMSSDKRFWFHSPRCKKWMEKEKRENTCFSIRTCA